MIEQLPTTGVEPSFGESVLPWGLMRRRRGLDSKLLDPINQAIREDRLVVVDQKSNQSLVGKRLLPLLDHPGRGGVIRQVQMQDFPWSMFDDEPGVEQLESGCRNDEKSRRFDAIPGFRKNVFQAAQKQERSTQKARSSGLG